MSDGPQLLSGSAVALGGRGLLITGAPGSGKSTLALELIALGAVLVADDMVEAEARGGAIEMRAPERLAGLIEARGIGILRMAHRAASLDLIADLDTEEPERVPEHRVRDLLGCAVPVLSMAGGTARAARLAAALSAEARLGPDFLPQAG